MPKEQRGLNEHSSCATSSKNAKNKSNNMTLRAMRDTKDTDDSSGTGSHCSSEKDSGYSDGSDWQQTDAEDQRSNKSQSRGSEHAETSQPGQNKDDGQGNPGNLTLMLASHQLPPIYIINNMVLNQSDMIHKRGQLPLRNGGRETGSSDATHMIIFQQPSLSQASVQLHKPLHQRSNVTGKKEHSTYLPILKSYPRIAPHPGKKPPDKSSLNDESQNLSKRVCTEHKRDDTPVTSSVPEQHFSKQPKVAVLTSGLPCSTSTRDARSSSSPNTVSSSQDSPSGSNLNTTSSVHTTRGLHRNSTTSTRHRRFLNTVEILRQSGLLDITLRTKELMRQSSATERDIAQLRQHTELLWQAAINPACSISGITTWEHVHKAMAESGRYPNLKILQNLQTLCHPDSASQLANISTGDASGPQTAESSEVLPFHLLTTIQQPNSEQARELQVGDKFLEEVTFIPPDSSTD
ncbi:CLOCK-interacting pacemaker-like isoform X2 [Plectropomus leopardus]|uniref:CLOCK-interacting pacemaker-like isoform X2 n=1 Tax=Plectropomus leopardus TaxID=160734 RepID=UPI001C4B2A70|nr:CLOCK-interacting pacemaker-like isoform X2 [Plectropomus leopardus]